MRKKLSLELRRELLTRTAEDYASARKGIKSQIVDQLVAATGYGRKHAITLLNNPPGSVSSSRPRRARYDERVKQVLVDLVAWIIPKDALSSCFSTPGIT